LRKGWREEVEKRRLIIEEVKEGGGDGRILVKCQGEIGERFFKVVDLESGVCLNSIKFESTERITNIQSVNKQKLSNHYFSLRHIDSKHTLLFQTYFTGTTWSSHPLSILSTNVSAYALLPTANHHLKFNLIVGFQNGSLQIFLGVKHTPAGPIEFMNCSERVTLGSYPIVNI
jgi:hypothetical protein